MLKNSVDPAYLARRKKLMALDPAGCFIFFGAREVVRNNNYHYPFRQDSHFYYLSEFTEPDAIMVLACGKSYLFCKERDPKREVWDGETYGPDRAKDVFQFDEAFLIKDFETKLDLILSGALEVSATKIYYQLGQRQSQDSRVLRIIGEAKRHIGKGRHAQLPILDPTSLLSQMRMVKDALEIERMRKAAQASVKAHTQLLKRARAGTNEKELFVEFQYAGLKNGGSDLGYGAIVASGWNATTLHYTHNNEILKHGDLVLVDAGIEHEYYTADVTQTFPVSEKFSPEQKLVYQKVLDCNRAVIEMMKPGVTYRQLHTKSVEMLTAALIEIGILGGNLEECIEKKAYSPFYPHGVGHHLGLDVHDAGLYDERGKDFVLTEGMVLTVEPGLYFRDKATSGKFFGIGIRIEDDVLITVNGADVLTKDLPRDVSAIEVLRIGN